MVTPTTPRPDYETTAPPASSAKGTAALVFGILSLFFALLFFPVGFVMAVVAIILGVMGRRESGGADGKATGGLVTGVIGLLIAVAIGVFVGSFFAKNADTIRDCSREATEAAREACVEQRMQQENTGN